MVAPRLVIDADTRTAEAKTALDQAHLNGAPVVDGAKRFAGSLARSALTSSDDRRRSVGDLVDAGAPAVSASSRLDVALESLTEAPLSWVPVLDDERRVVGTLSVSDVVRAYRQELAGSAERMSGLGASTGASQVTLDAHSRISGKDLRQADLPKGLLITSITRGDHVFVPNGSTVLTAGDRLSVLGETDDLESLGRVEPLGPDNGSPRSQE